METEFLFSGYCRQTDQARMVALEMQQNGTWEADCLYECCVYRDACPVGQQISEVLARP